MKCQGELSIIGAYGGYSKTPAKHAPVVGNSVLNLLINILGSGSTAVAGRRNPLDAPGVLGLSDGIAAIRARVNNAALSVGRGQHGYWAPTSLAIKKYHPRSGEYS
jgi:hypothetical protein